MNVAVIGTPDSFLAASRLLRGSVARGDFDDDEDFADAASALAAALAEASEYELDDDENCEAEVDSETLDQVLAIIEGDPAAEHGHLADFVTAGGRALDNAPVSVAATA